MMPAIARDDAALPPLAFHFWYPTLKWQGDEIVVTETTPIDVGVRAKIGVGVFFGAEWDTAEFYLVPQTDAADFVGWTLGLDWRNRAAGQDVPPGGICALRICPNPCPMLRCGQLRHGVEICAASVGWAPSLQFASLLLSCVFFV